MYENPGGGGGHDICILSHKMTSFRQSKNVIVL